MTWSLADIDRYVIRFNLAQLRDFNRRVDDVASNIC